MCFKILCHTCRVVYIYWIYFLKFNGYLSNKNPQMENEQRMRPVHFFLSYLNSVARWSDDVQAVSYNHKVYSYLTEPVSNNPYVRFSEWIFVCKSVRFGLWKRNKEETGFIFIWFLGIILEQEANKIPLHLISILLLHIWLIKSFFHLIR